MDDLVEEVQTTLDNAARQCLRYLCTHDLTPAQTGRLARFLFGCMNQKHELPRRVAARGSGEFHKVLMFIDRMFEVMRQIDDGRHSGKINNGH
jgi:hypothetical protein